MTGWYYNGRLVTCIEDLPKIVQNAYGFVYCITNETNGKKYIGQKKITSVRTSVISKNVYEREKRNGADNVFKTKNKKKSKKGSPVWIYKRRNLKESNWSSYCGSNKQLLEDIEKGHTIFKEIWDFAETSKKLTFLETEAQFMMQVLRKPKEYYNDNILGKFYSRELNIDDV